MEEAYEGGLDVIFNYGSGRRPQGLSWVRIFCISENIFEPHLSPYMPPCLVASLGGSKTGMKSFAAKNLPSKVNGAFFFFFFFFFFSLGPLLPLRLLQVSSSSFSSSTGFFFLFFFFYRFLLLIFLGPYWVM